MPNPNPSPHPLSSPLLSVSWIDEYVVHVQLNRPNRRNAINKELWIAVGRVFSKLGRTGDDVRCVLLSGSGSSFCAGIDISDPSLLGSPAKTKDPARNAMTFEDQILQMQECFTAIEDCPIPVVCAIHGYCIGGGVDLACATDVRLCSRDTLFSIREVKLGLAADVGTLQRISKLCGNDSIIRDLCLTGRNFDALEASQLGFVGKVVESCSHLLYDATKKCLAIAKNSPVAVRATKRALLYARDHSVSDALRQIASFNSMALQSRDLKDSFKSQKEEIRYEGFPEHSKL